VHVALEGAWCGQPSGLLNRALGGFFATYMKVDALRPSADTKNTHSRDVAARHVEARDEADFSRIANTRTRQSGL